ncbi:retrovirus-related pol polyprotein from transposon TNT 1-94 [Tanacetum coccineum]
MKFLATIKAFSSRGSRRPRFVNEQITKIPRDDAACLEVPFFEKEVWDAVCGCGSDKAPGPDGFNFKYIKRFWDVIKVDVLKAVRCFWETGEFSKGCNASFVNLIPKVGDPLGLSDYRPISLIGSFYKIIAKLLAQRVKKVVAKVIGEVQNAFIEGRSILDGVLIANETMQFLKKSKRKGLIFKVDFEKAYDSIEWGYLLEIMKRMGFGDRWCKWVIACLSSSSISILVNGSPTKEFVMERGVRQGDPLSPFLFILAAEGDVAFRDRFVRLYRMESNKEAKVGHKGSWVNREWEWCWEWSRVPRGRTVGDLEELEATLADVRLKQFNEDSWAWKLDAKVNVFMWRALNGRLPVRVELNKKGIDLDTLLCPGCDNVVESLDHCLVLCENVINVWDMIFAWRAKKWEIQWEKWLTRPMECGVVRNRSAAVKMDTCKNVLKSDTLLFEQFQKFVEMYEQFEIFLDMIKQLKKFFAFEPHAMSTALNTGTGSVDTPNVALSDVYYIPNLTMNLASVSKICDSGYDVNFSVSDCSIYDQNTQEVVGTGHRQGDLYVLDHFRDIHDTASSSVDLSSFWLNRSSSAFYLWHSRLGYVSGSRLRFLASTGALGKLDAHDISDCSGCKLAKFSALPFSNSVSSSTAPFDIVHSDVWGPSPVSTKGGSNLKEFRALVKTQHSAIIKCFRCDLGGEYTSNEFVGLLKSDGTIYQTSCTDTPQQNGVAERKHRHLIETARSFLLSADVPSVFWGEAVLTATYVINRIPTAHNSGLSPFERLYGQVPDYSSLRVFGCTCFVLKPHVERTKLTSKSTLCVFLGYGSGQKGYCCYDHVGQKLYTSRHVQFLEHVPYFSVPASSHHLTQLELIKLDPFDDATETSESFTIPQETPQEIPQETQQETPTNTTPPVTIVTQPPPTATQSSTEVVDGHPPSGRPKRNRKSTKRDDFVYSCYSNSFSSFIASVNRLHEPESYREAVCDPLWQLAIGSRWVYKIKTKSDGSVERYKAHLVAKGYSQEYDDSVGIGYLKLELAHRFAMKDLGTLRYFLGIEVASSPKGYILSQSKYIGNLLDRARITNKMVEDIPIDAKAKYTPTDGDPFPDPSLYQTIVGSLVYLTVTRPNISYAVHIMSRFVSAPTTVHWAAVLHIPRYLGGTQFQTLMSPSTSALDLRAYCDSD